MYSHCMLYSSSNILNTGQDLTFLNTYKSISSKGVPECRSSKAQFVSDCPKNTFFFFFLYNGIIDKVLKSREREVAVPILLHGQSEGEQFLVPSLSQVLYGLPPSHAVALWVLS